MLGALAGGARDGRGPGLHREARLLAKLLVAGGVADQDRRGERAAALFSGEVGVMRGDELDQLAVELVDLAVQGAQLRDLLAGDPHARTGGQLAQPSVDAIKLARVVDRLALQRGLKLGAQYE